MIRLHKNVALSDSGYVFHPATGESYTLNPIGLEIVQMLRQNMTDDEIQGRILDRYQVDASTLNATTWTSLVLWFSLNLPTMNKRPVTIAVTGLNNIDSPGPGIPVIRSLRDSKMFEPRVIGLAYENLEPGIYMHHLVDKTYMVPYPSQGSDALIERVLEIHRNEHFDVLIPNFDAELYAFIKSAPLLRSEGIATMLPTMAQFEERHKSNLPEFGKKYGVNIPRSVPVSNTRRWKTLPKNTSSHHGEGEILRRLHCRNMHEAEAFFFKVSAKWGIRLLFRNSLKGLNSA
jgi:carbamoyl-phosphate synthase large subunit